MANIDSPLKLFALSNQLLEHELDRIESEHQIDLGRGHASIVETDETYYPQIESTFRAEAALMAPQYETFYSLERTIRAFVSDTMLANVGEGWWETERVPEHVKKDVRASIKKEIDSGVTRRSTEELAYATFGQLTDIIKHNWDSFADQLTSQRAVERVLGNLNTIRGPIAHCSPLAEDEVLRLQLSVRDWFRLLG